MVTTTAAGNSKDATTLDVAVVGGGFAGVYALYRLRALGFKVRVFEAGAGIGGTWFWNTYPGARCDVESLEYSYSFSDELQQEWNWPERYAAQPQILEYINFVADKFDLRKDIQLNTRIVAAHYDDSDTTWFLRTSDGETIACRFCIMATGNLSAPQVPAFKGLETFKGKWYHSGRWPAEPVDFTDRTVGIVGTGSSGIQIVPMIARQAKHLFVFQRTANFIVPAQNRPMDKRKEQAFKANYAQRRLEARQTSFGVSGFPPPTMCALDVSDAERRRNFERLWQEGGSVGFLSCYKDFLIDEKANHTAAEFVRDKIREIVKDPKVAALLCPDDHPIGAKRLCLDMGYYEAFNRSNVSLVDVRSNPIVEIAPSGLRTTEHEFELDDIIFATGFDAVTGALRDIDIRGVQGRRLADKWAEGPLTYLGIMTAGFPNLFMVTGPGSPGVKSQMVLSIEQHVDWITGLLKTAAASRIRRIEANADAEAKWAAHVYEIAKDTLYMKANSWYLGANVPGKPRVFMPYIAGVGAYRKICDEIAEKGYEGITLQ